MLSRVKPPGYKLLGVSLVHRHGDRTPITPLLNEAYWLSQLPAEDDPGIPVCANGHPLDSVDALGSAAIRAAQGQTYGQLTAKGRGQLLALGNMLRGRLTNEAYCGVEGGIIPSTLIKPTQSVEVHSTQFARTIQSAMWLLGGLWPQESRTEGSTVHIDTSSAREMVPDHPDRPTAQIELEEEVHSSEHWHRITAEHEAVHRRVMRALHSQGLLPPVTELDWDHLREVVQCLTEHKIALKGVSEEDAAVVSAVSMRQWLTRCGYPGIGPLAIGNLVRRLVAHPQELADSGTAAVPLRVFSAHDSTLTALLANLALTFPDEEWPAWGLEWPPYASILEVETWSSSENDAAVRFVFNGTVLAHQRSAGEHGLVTIVPAGATA